MVFRLAFELRCRVVLRHISLRIKAIEDRTERCGIGTALIRLEGYCKIIAHEEHTRKLCQAMLGNGGIALSPLGNGGVALAHYMVIVGKGEVELTHIVIEQECIIGISCLDAGDALAALHRIENGNNDLDRLLGMPAVYLKEKGKRANVAIPLKVTAYIVYKPALLAQLNEQARVIARNERIVQKIGLGNAHTAHIKIKG